MELDGIVWSELYGWHCINGTVWSNSRELYGTVWLESHTGRTEWMRLIRLCGGLPYSGGSPVLPLGSTVSNQSLGRFC